MSLIAVPDLVGGGLGRGQAEPLLNSLLLRYVAKFRVVGGSTGLAVEQSPEAGKLVGPYSVVIVTYTTPLDIPDSGIEGPGPSGSLSGRIDGVVVDAGGAWIAFVSEGEVASSIWLYRDQSVPLLARTEWIRRGAMLSLAQRAFSNQHSVRAFVTDNFVRRLEIFSPSGAMAALHAVEDSKS
jgi:hypothetical protein